MKDLKVTLVQSDLYWEDIGANLSMFEEKIRAITEPTDLILLPEMFTTGFSMKSKELSELMNGKTHKWMKMMAEDSKAVISGSYIVTENNQFYNRLIMVYPDGMTRHYDKRHLFGLGGENAAYSPGKDVGLFEINGWRIKPGICYDLRFPVWARSRKSIDDLYEYDLIFYVANWPSPRIHAWDTLLAARAIENLAYCVGVNRLGEDITGATYPGHSAAYNFKGDQLGYTEKDVCLTVQLDARHLQTFRDKYPFQKDADSFDFK